jgi:hypothetical protein
VQQFGTDAPFRLMAAVFACQLIKPPFSGYHAAIGGMLLDDLSETDKAESFSLPEPRWCECRWKFAACQSVKHF